MARKAISKTLRFEVFKRDCFKCQYCGAEAPKAVLHVDHIHPVAKGGTNDILNLITSCSDCNSGKGARTLSDDSAVAKQRAQIEELQERREQMEMMLKWREASRAMGEDEVEAVKAHFSSVIPGWHIRSDGATKKLKAYLRQHSMASVLDAIDVAAERYVVTDDEGRPTGESVELAWKKVGGILRINALPEDMKRLYYIKGILNKRLSYVPYTAIREMEKAYEEGVSIQDMELEAKHTYSWSAFSRWLTTGN